MKLKIDITGRPFGKLNMKPIIRGGHAQAIQPKENDNYMVRVQSAVTSAILNQKDHVAANPDTSFDVIIIAHFELQREHYVYHKKTGTTDINPAGQKKLSGELRPTIKPDCDNISKIILDSITHLGLIWKDDSQVATLLVMKKYAETPHVEVIIESKEENTHEKN